MAVDTKARERQVLDPVPKQLYIAGRNEAGDENVLPGLHADSCGNISKMAGRCDSQTL